MQVITYDDVKSKIIEIKHKIGIIDSDVAELYGVQTRDINKAVKNNLDKFPDGYILELDKGFYRISELARICGKTPYYKKIH